MLTEKFEYQLSETAKADLGDIYDYIAYELLNPDAAEAFLDEFERKTEEYCRAPKTGFPVSNEYVRRDDVRKYFVKNYTVYYVPDFENEVIFIVRVVYKGRDQNAVWKN